MRRVIVPPRVSPIPQERVVVPPFNPKTYSQEQLRILNCPTTTYELRLKNCRYCPPAIYDAYLNPVTEGTCDG